ncbi:MAG: UvrD-helicase domain-containing protein [Gammaproteobacteria bacterium]|nr:UvrD-helicase domain-containing protein [Gammaproteobacteria bacterium]
MNSTNSPASGTGDSLIAARPDVNATVSASAGTGKTWLLVTRIIRLLLADTEPGSILALTFTRKAAAEMQMRLQERLYQLATADDNDLSGLLIQAGSIADDDMKRKSRELYEKLLHANFQVRLQTFHSFCQDILSHFPMEADITPGFELIENTALLQQQAWEELFAEATRNPQGRLANDLDALMQACNGPSNTRTSLNSMLHHRSDWWAFTENKKDAAAYASMQLQQQLEVDTATDPYSCFFADVSCEQLGRFEELLRKHATKTNLGHAELIANALREQDHDEDMFRLLAPVFLTSKQTPRSRKSSKSQQAVMGSNGEASFLQLHQEICKSMLQAMEMSRRLRTLELNAAWYRTGQHYIDLYQKLKREQRVLDFTDLEWNCYRLLNEADNAHWVQYKIDQRIDHVLIDEFQDTNPTQWQLITPLLEEIAAGQGERSRSFFLVGDEKQSIYSFRRANPKLQQQASDYLARTMSSVDIKLDASRRSSPAIIDTVNAVFKQDEIRHYMPDFSVHSTYLKDVPGSASLFPLQQTDDDDPDVFDETDPRPPRNPLLQARKESHESTRIEEAHLIAEQIEHLVNEQVMISVKNENGEDCTRPVVFGDIMVLMRNRTHIGVYESLLRERGIPFIGSQRGSLLDKQEIQDLEKLLDSLIAPFNNLSIAQVLKSPIFAATDEDLVRLSLQHKDAKWYQRLQQLEPDLPADHALSRAARLLPHWHRLADTMPVHDLLDRIYAEANIIQRYAASVSPAQQQRVTANLQRFHELSLEHDSGRYPSLSHFLHYLRSIRQYKEGRPDEPATTHGQPGVKLMTIHASKGLESPVVILADCDNQSGHNNAYSALVDWPATSSRPTRFQLITNKESIDESTDAVLTQKEEAQTREELNLLYVALTRARQYLLVTGSASRYKSGWYEYIETAMQSLTRVDENNAYYYSSGAYAGTAGSRTVQAHAGVSRIRPDPELTRPIIHAVKKEHMIAPSLSFHDNENGLFTQSDSDAVRRGIAIHRALDLMSREPPHTTDQARQQISQESSLVDNDELASWIDEAGNTISNIKFQHIFKPSEYRRAINELPIMYQHNSQPVFGLIDRLVMNDDQILLIDYKTHQVETDLQLESLVDAFSEQLYLYQTGVKKLWPGIRIKSGLLFTHSARLVWTDDTG